jgi:hypothetical protein
MARNNLLTRIFLAEVVEAKDPSMDSALLIFSICYSHESRGKTLSGLDVEKKSSEYRNFFLAFSIYTYVRSLQIRD